MQLLFIALVIFGYIALLLVEGLVYGAIAKLIGRMVKKLTLRKSMNRTLKQKEDIIHTNTMSAADTKSLKSRVKKKNTDGCMKLSA